MKKSAISPSARRRCARVLQPAPARHVDSTPAATSRTATASTSRQDLPPAAYSADRETGLLDSTRSAPRPRVRPLILVAGYSAYPRKINFAKMREIADEVGAMFMVDMAHFAGSSRARCSPAR